MIFYPEKYNFMKNKARLIYLLIGTIIGVITGTIVSSMYHECKVPSLNEEVNYTKIKQPEFLTSTNPESDLIDVLNYYGVQHPNIVYAQAILETGHFRSKVCREYNNLFGLYNSRAKDYYKFDHWSESVVAYLDFIQDRYKPPNDYYKFLLDIGYAEDPKYINKLKRIVNQYDKRGTTDTVCLIN